MKINNKTLVIVITAFVMITVILGIVGLTVKTIKQKEFESRFDPRLAHCWNIKNYHVDLNCIADVVMGKNDISICDKAGSPYNRWQCYSLVASSMQDGTICEKITNPVQSFRCHKAIRKYKPDMEVCNKIPGISEEKGECIKMIATEQNDYSICDKIELVTTASKWDCYVSVSDSLHLLAIKSTKDRVSICQKIVESSEMIDCYKSMFPYRGKLNLDDSFCDTIHNTVVKMQCLELLARDHGDESICMQIVPAGPETEFDAKFYRARCLQNIVREEDCDKVEKVIYPCKDAEGQDCEISPERCKSQFQGI
jgi:hypothetical protein